MLAVVVAGVDEEYRFERLKIGTRTAALGSIDRGVTPQTPAGDDDSARIRPKPPRRQRLSVARALTIVPDSHPIHWSRRVAPGPAWASILTHIDIA
jgi:hypothetical protein